MKMTDGEYQRITGEQVVNRARVSILATCNNNNNNNNNNKNNKNINSSSCINDKSS